MSEAEFRFLSVEDVLALHAMQFDSYGGATGIRAPDLLGVMNPIEVLFAMRNHHDERVQMALDEMLKPYGLTKKEK